MRVGPIAVAVTRIHVTIACDVVAIAIPVEGSAD
jgi:hypothetical protein